MADKEAYKVLEPFDKPRQKIVSEIGMSPEEAYKKLQEALAKGQAGFAALSPEAKEVAMGPAAESVKDVGTPRPADMSETEGYTPIPGMTPHGLKEEPKKEMGERPSSFDPILPPPPPEETDFGKREDYKGFRKPRGMGADQEAAWKAGIDDRLLDEGARIEERIDAEHPREQAKDFFRRLGEGDIEAWKDAGYYGLNAAALSPVGQIPQVGADISIAGVDAARGDYTGAAISGAAVLLPVTAAMLKGAIKNADVAKLVDTLEDPTKGKPIRVDEGAYDKAKKDMFDKSGALSDFYAGRMYYAGQLQTNPEVFEHVTKMSDDELVEAVMTLKAVGRASMQRGPELFEIMTQATPKAKKFMGGPADKVRGDKFGLNIDAEETLDDVDDKVEALEALLSRELIHRAGGPGTKKWSEIIKKMETARGSQPERVFEAEKGMMKRLNEELLKVDPETKLATPDYMDIERGWHSGYKKTE